MKKNNGFDKLAIISFVLSIIGGTVISLVLALISLLRTKKHKILALTAIIISIIELITVVVCYNIYKSSKNEPVESDAKCAEVYECKNDTSGIAVCKYKDDNNKEHSIKCPFDENIVSQITNDKNESYYTSIIRKTTGENENYITNSFILANTDLYAKMPKDEELKNKLENPTIVKFNNEEYVLITPSVANIFIVNDTNKEYVFYKNLKNETFYLNNYKNSSSSLYETIRVSELKEIENMDSEGKDNTSSAYGQDTHGEKTYIKDFINKYSRLK